MRLPKRALFLCWVTAAFSAAPWAQAGIKELTNHSYVNGVVPDTVTNDLSINFAGQYTGSQILIELSQGTMYQHAYGSDFPYPPSASLVSIFPEIEFDSFVAQGSAVSVGPYGDPVSGPNAVNLGSATGTEDRFDSEGADTIWWPAGGTPTIDLNDFLTARITLSNDAQGTWSYMASADRKFGMVEQMPIIDGRLMVDLPNLGDYDDSGQAAQGDLDLVLLNWGETAPPVPDGWDNEQPDGLIGQARLDQVLLHWGNGAPLPDDALRWTVEPVQIDPDDTGGRITSQMGDFNGSGTTEQADLDLLLINWGKTSPPVPEGWVNQQPEGTIGGCHYCDLIFLNWGDSVDEGSSELERLGNGAALPMTSAPEPSALMLCALAVLLLVPCRSLASLRL
jgi:hypothetical protein